MEYRCLRHLEWVVQGNKEEYLRQSLSLLKGAGESEEAALSRLAGILATGSGAYPVLADAVAEELSGQGNGWYASVPKHRCHHMTGYLEQHGSRCACGDCRRWKGAKGKLFQPAYDAEVLRWCLCDTCFASAIFQDPGLQAYIKRGLFGSPVLLLAAPQESYASPVYWELFQVLEGWSYPMFYHRHGAYYGVGKEEYQVIVHTVLDRLRASLTGLKEEYHETVIHRAELLLAGMDDRKLLGEREMILAGLAAYASAPEKKESSGCIPGSPEHIPAGTSKKNSLPLQTEQMADDRQKADNDRISGPEDIPESIYPYDITGCCFPVLDRDTDFTKLFYLLVERQAERLPMEIIRTPEGGIYALLYVEASKHSPGEFYLVPEAMFGQMEKSRVFTKAKPLCFLPFAVLAHFPSLRKCYCLCMAYNAGCRREYRPGPIRIITEVLGIAYAGDGILFQMRHAVACYARLIAGFSDEGRAVYRRMVQGAVYRASAYLMLEIRSASGQGEPVLFEYDGRNYHYHYDLHHIRAKRGYVKYRILVANLMDGGMEAVFSGLAEAYCTHAFFRELPMVFVGMAESRREFDFVVEERSEDIFLEVIRLDFMRLTEGRTNGHADILIQREQEMPEP